MSVAAPQWIAILGAIVAIGSAIAASLAARSTRRQADAAENALREARAQTVIARAELEATRRQSEIALHSHRLDIYESFLKFRHAVNSRGSRFGLPVVFEYWRKAKMAEFYFHEKVHKPMSAVVDQALAIARAVEDLQDPENLSAEDRQNLRVKRDELSLRLADTLDQIDADLRFSLRVVPPEA